MKGFCPSCKKESVLTRILKIENIAVKGESIPVEMDVYQCLECSTEFDNPAYDPRAAAYREYRQRKGMVQPEVIRALRSKYGLSQRELSDLIGFGGATLSRYENGALQDESHDTILRLILLPVNLLKILEENTAVLDAAKRAEITSRLREEVNGTDIIRLINRKGQYGPANIFNGQKVLDLSRLLNAVKILCYRKNVYKTKLTKLLFYADFRHFKENGLGITGLCYTNAPQGPVPEQYEIILQRLTELDRTFIMEEDPSMDCEGVYYRCEEEPDRGAFSFSELHILIEVDSFFKTFTSSSIKHYAREEYGCQRTKPGELITYEYADRLRI